VAALESSNRQVLPYYDREALDKIRSGQRPTPLFYLTCNDEPGDYVYISVKPNKSENNDKYPYWPFCYTTDHRAKNNGLKNHLQMYLNGIIPKVDHGATTKGIVVTDKILSIGSVGKGVIPKNITNFLVDSFGGEYYRRGVYNDNNSFIAAVLYLLSDSRYFMLLDNPSSIPEYLQMVRIKIADHTHVGLVKQEMYDYTDEEIRIRLRDPNVYYDPSLFYRAVEEFFRINIVVFKNEDGGNFDIPRHDHFHVRSKRSRSTLYILKNRGSVSSHLRNPQCEPIIHSNGSVETKIFSYINSIDCQNMISRIANCYRWAFQGPDLKGSYNVNQQFNIPQMMKTKPLAQYIDKSGKVQAFVFSIFDNKTITLFVPPCQPENIKSYTFDQLFSPVSSVDIYEIFGMPSRQVVIGSNCVGFWYRVFDIVEAIYIPCGPQAIPDVPLTGLPDSLNSNVAFTDKLRIVKRNATIIEYLLRWFYHSKDAGIAYEMMNNNSMIGNVDYDFSRLSVRLPQLEKLADKLQYIEGLKSNFVVGGKMILSEKAFYKIRTFMVNYSSYADRSLPFNHLISRFFEYSTDVIVPRNTLAFVNKEDLRKWQNTLIANRLSDRKAVIYSSLMRGSRSLLVPYLYKNTEGRIFLIQNVYEGELERAVSVAVKWNSYWQNQGFNAPRSNRVYPHVVYLIDDNANSIPYDNKYHLPGRPYLHILCYDSQEEYHNEDYTNTYAAMLPLF